MNLIWETAARLGYSAEFLDELDLVGGDDHYSFIKRGVAACDIIDFSVRDTYWHTPQDTLDKVDPRSLAIVGYVLLETVQALERNLRRTEGPREFVSIGLGLTALLVISLIVTRRKWLTSQERDSQKDSSPTQNPGAAGH